MQPSAGDAPFDDQDYLFEPWWPGARTLLFAEGGNVRLQTEQLADALAAFREVRSVANQLMADGVVIDGTLLVLDADGRPDGRLLRDRLAGIASGGTPAFVASDLLYAEERSLMARPFSERRQRLAALLPDDDRAMVGRAFRGEGRNVATALAAMGIDGLSARHLQARYRAGAAEGAWLRIPVAGVPEPRPRPSLALIQRLPL